MIEKSLHTKSTSFVKLSIDKISFIFNFSEDMLTSSVSIFIKSFIFTNDDDKLKFSDF